MMGSCCPLPTADCRLRTFPNFASFTMKPFANLYRIVIVAIAILAIPAPGKTADLTPEQVAAVQAQLKNLRDTLEGKASERNRSAWSVFMSASQDNRAAIELLEKCTKIVDFDREGRDDSDFRNWQTKQKDRYRDEQYMEGLRLQLRWLAITCKAAEAEQFDTVLPEVINYVESLTQLSEMPGNTALASVGGSIFVRAYEIERLIGKNQNWESVPYNIAGIYEKTILPYLRKESPDRLMSAWDKRIAQQIKLVAFIKAKQEAEVRGGRDEKRKIQDQQRRQQQSRNVLKAHNEDDFLRDTLPQLKWDRLIDKYNFIDKASAAQEMLTFLSDNIANKKTIDWLTQFQGLIANSAASGIGNEAKTTEPASAAATTPSPKGPVTADSLGLE